MKQNIMYGALFALLVGLGSFGVSQAYADQLSQYSSQPTPDHSQGNDFQCATSPTVELTCEIENVLKFFLPQIVTIGQSQDSHLQQIINNQQTEIQNQKVEIELLKTIASNVPSTTPEKTTHIDYVPQNISPLVKAVDKHQCKTVHQGTATTVVCPQP